MHANDPAEAIRRVRNWLSEHRMPVEPPLPGVAAMLRDYGLFQTEVGALLAARRLDPVDDLPHSDFLFSVRDWITTRVKTPHLSLSSIIGVRRQPSEE
ncbi:MAG: hypothetical protein WBE91_16050 [Steroidobacteraceae bacterium]